MNVIPQYSGLAEMELEYHGDSSSKVDVRPSSLLVRPLVLDVEFQPMESRRRRRTTSRESHENVKAVAV